MIFEIHMLKMTTSGGHFLFSFVKEKRGEK